jgi:hypothetical protein
LTALPNRATSRDRLSRLPVFLLLGLLTMVATPARAELRVAYDAPASCPGEAEFGSEFARSMQGSAVAARDFAYEVTIGAEPDGYRGTLRVVAPTPSESLRQVRDSDCRAVVRALAFIAAVLADPDVATRGVAADAPANPESDPPASLPAAPATEPASPKPLPPPVGATPRARGREIAPEREHGRSPSTVARAHSTRFRAGISAAAVAETALVPELALGPRLGLFARRGALLALLSLTFGSSERLSASVGSAELRWLRGRLEGCAAFPASRLLEVHGCASFDGGILEGAGQNAPFTDTRRAAWLAPGALGRVSLALGQRLDLSAELGSFVPLVRPRFLIETPEGQELLHAVPILGFSAGLGLAVYLL